MTRWRLKHSQHFDPPTLSILYRKSLAMVTMPLATVTTKVKPKPREQYHIATFCVSCVKMYLILVVYVPGMVTLQKLIGQPWFCEGSNECHFVFAHD